MDSQMNEQHIANVHWAAYTHTHTHAHIMAQLSGEVRSVLIDR